MKKLRPVIALLCVTMLFACQANLGGFGKKQPKTETQYIPEETPKQTLKQEEVQQPEEKPIAPEALVAQPSPVKIALLVPLSGSYKELGQGLLDAAQLAIFRAGNKNIILVPIDTKDSPVAATQAAKKAVEEGAKIILGPVFSNAAKAVAKIAAENNIQVVSFSNDKSLAGSGAFAIGFLPEHQIRRVLNFAAAKGMKNFVTVLPSGAYGAAVTEELKKFSSSNAGTAILRSEIYQLDNQGRALSLDEHMQAVVTAAMKSQSETAPVGLLMPANSAVTAEMLSSLKKINYNKAKIQLIGTDQWNDPILFKEPLMEGAFFTASPPERRNDFENKFRATYGHEPQKLAGLAYDGIALVTTIARMAGGDNFSKEMLVSPRGFIGVDGIFRLQDNGLTERGFAVMRVQGDHLVVIDPAPTSFSEMQ